MADQQPEKLRLGGMALRNGLLIHGPTHWAAAVRDGDGGIEVASERKPEMAPALVAKLPGLRGPIKLAEAMLVLPLVRRRLPAARLPFEHRRVLGAVAATLAATSLLRKRAPAGALREGIVQALGAVPAMVALSDRDLAAYHGVEHKAIAAYERGDGTPAAEEVAAVPKEHDRCGSNLVAPLLASTAAGNVAARRAGLSGPVAEAVVGLGSVAFAVEVFAWSERHADTALSRLLRLPGYEIQRVFGTREPSAEQLDVARAALAEILRVEAAA
jgi:uncharacterized protein YqhQ